MNIDDITVNQTKLAEILGLTTRQIRNLSNNGILRVIEGETTRYPLLHCVRAYVAFLRRPRHPRRRRIVSVRNVGMDELKDITFVGVMGGSWKMEGK